MGVCPTCRKLLFEAKKKGKDAVPTKVKESWNIDYNAFRAPSRKSPCACHLCARVRVADHIFQARSEHDVPRCVSEEENVDAANELESMAEAESLEAIPRAEIRPIDLSFALPSCD